MAPPKNQKPFKADDEDAAIEREMKGVLLHTQTLAELKGLPERHEISRVANGVALKMLMMIATDHWTVANAEQAAKVAKLAHDIGRVADGLPTNFTATADKDSVKKMIEEHKRAAFERQNEDRAG